jgi:hypothetical protein
MGVPAIIQTPGVKKYEDFRYGWIIDFAMNCFSGYPSTLVHDGAPAPPPETFNVTNVNVAAWAEAARARGVDYAMLSVLNEYGFAMYDTHVEHNMTVVTPTHAKYGIQPGFDTHVTQKFVTEFRNRGIEPVAYINYVGNVNMPDYTTFSGITGLRREETIVYYENLLKEIATRFDFKYYWFDVADTPHPDVQQRLYDAVKSITPDASIVGNALGETSFARFPYDLESTEEHAVYDGNHNYRTKTRTHTGTDYYVGQEIIATPYSEFSEWYYIDDECPYQPQFSPFDGTTPWVKLQQQDPALFQGLINEAHLYNIPFCSLMMVNRAGNLVADTLDYLDGMDFNEQILANIPKVLIAKATVGFTSIGIDSSNTRIIYLVDSPIKSYMPGRAINGITGFVSGKGYYLVSKTDLNLTAYTFTPSDLIST